MNYFVYYTSGESMALQTCGTKEEAGDFITETMKQAGLRLDAFKVIKGEECTVGVVEYASRIELT